MHSLKEGQYVKHGQYGLGTVTESDSERTSIDFHLHGPKKFVTQMMTLEITTEAPPPKARAARAKKAAAADSPAASRKR